MSDQQPEIEPISEEAPVDPAEDLYQQVTAINRTKTAKLWISPQAAVVGYELSLPGHRGPWTITEVSPFVLTAEQMLRTTAETRHMETVQ